MFRRVIISLVAIIATLVLVTAAYAGKLTVSTSPNPVIVGSTFDITVCNTGGRLVMIQEIAPDGSLVTWWQLYNTATDCYTLTTPPTDQVGTYTVTVGSSKNPDSGNVSTTETVVS